MAPVYLVPAWVLRRNGDVERRISNVWNFFKEVPETERFWKARDAFEKTVTKVLAASNDAQFDKLFKEFSDLAAANGATDETLAAINKVWKKNNEGYIK